jgi:hypothetical protein
MARVNYLGLTPVIPVVTDDSTLVGQGTYYPIGFTKEEWVYFYWKVKLFGFRGSASWTHDVTPETPGGDTGSHSMTRNPITCTVVTSDPIYSFVPKSEKDLICRHWTESKLYSQSAVVNYPDGPDPFVFETLIFGAPLLHASEPAIPNINCYYLNGLYYPFFIIRLDFGEIRIESQTQGEIPLTIKFLGRDIELKLPHAYSLGNLNFVIHQSFFEIYAAEEWSYQ